MSSSNDRTPTGREICRYPEPAEDFEISFETPYIEAIQRHIEQHVGPVTNVFHEVVSHLVHVDVHRVAPTRNRPWHSLITSGMSYRPMQTPPGAEDWQHAEVYLALPADWPISMMTSQQRREKAWPLDLLQCLARFPH